MYVFQGPFALPKLVLVTVFYLNFCCTRIFPSVNLRLIAMIAGSGNPRLSVEVMGSAYDVAVRKSVELYPKVFQNFSVTHYFVPGSFSCAEADAKTTVGLSTLYTDDSVSVEESSNREFRVVLSPGCSFETVTLGDFAREEGVTVLASTASLDILNNKKRFPTLLPLASTSYNNLGFTLSGIMKRYGWSKFNGVCDTNQKDPQSLAMEVSCGILRSTFRSNSLGVNMVSVPFDSSKPETTEIMLKQCKTQSAVTVIASVPTAYEKILLKALALGMANGDYVFYFLPLTAFTQFEEVNWLETEKATDLIEILPFVFVLSFDEINWTAMSREVRQMAFRSKTEYNWTVPRQYEHNVLQLAAYESVLMLAEVLNDSLSQLDNLSAKNFTVKFFNRTFDLPSRRVILNDVGTRECNVFVRQFQNRTEKFEAVLMLESASKRLIKMNFSEIEWRGVTFPPTVTPKCGFNKELCFKKGNSLMQLIVALIVSVLLGAFTLCVTWKCLVKRTRKYQEPSWWIINQERFRIQTDKQTMSQVHRLGNSWT